MKTLLICSFLLLATSVFAQPQQGPPKPPPVAERWKHDSTKLNGGLALSTAQLASAKKVFFGFYDDLDKLMEKNKGQRPPKEEVDKIVAKRNEAVRKMLTKEQQTKFAAVEKEMGPRPPGEGNRPPQQKN